MIVHIQIPSSNAIHFCLRMILSDCNITASVIITASMIFLNKKYAMKSDKNKDRIE